MCTYIVNLDTGEVIKHFMLNRRVESVTAEAY